MGKHFILRRLYLTIHTKQAKHAREPSRKFQQGMKSICSQTCWRIFHPYSAEQKHVFCYLQYVFSLFPERRHLNHSLWTGTVFWTLANCWIPRGVGAKSGRPRCGLCWQEVGYEGRGSRREDGSETGRGIAPARLRHPKKETRVRLSTIHFQVLLLLVSGSCFCC